jgi:protein involved in polysaccharide export with SLBB domain
VSVSGEVAHPGVYGIRPGERLDSVLKRAGGFLPDAYPQGIVFERQQVRVLQQQKRQELIRELRQESGSFKASMQATAVEQAQLQQASYEQTQRAIQALEQAPVTGRMVINLMPNLRRFQNSPDNITLQAGDTIFIPKHPDFVLVTGQVYNSNAITYMPDRNAGWYLSRAGGPTPDANKGKIFIIRANGSIISSNSSGWWINGSVLGRDVEPGDTIVVPEEPVGGNVFWKNLVQIAQVASSAAVTAAVATHY